MDPQDIHRTRSAAPLPHLLSGRTTLVTGAGQGLGRAISLGLAEAGSRVICADLDQANAAATAAAITVVHGQAMACQLDVVDPDACRALAVRTRREFGVIDVLVNNAGVIIREGLDSPAAHENWRRVLDVNLTGGFNVTSAWLADLQETRGAIINLASLSSFVGTKGCLGYAASKGGVRQQTKYLAAELAEHGIRVNAIAPGIIETPLTEASRGDPDRSARMLSRIPMAVFGQPRDVVGPVVFLASDMAAYVTGVTLPVDGGYLAA
ncbi:SDR family NAD(P)-dependent oxidoreductase [Phenylobacterium sp.]|uniref:SDR family NAD(P)-dependent oxidoreductase n=1 Tax=Phenylobacterium sp. TaxID=1871053 RepID=UPI0035B49234